jgi:hypothetical protein
MQKAERLQALHVLDLDRAVPAEQVDIPPRDRTTKVEI